MKKVILITVFALSAFAGNAQSLASFKKFWTTFQPLLVGKKYTALAAHVNFPLKSYGVEDGMKVLTYTKATYGAALNKFLNLDDANHNPDNATDANGNYITMKKSEILDLYVDYDLIKDNWKSVSGNTARVDDLEFKFIGGKWKLTAFYDGRTE